ncbi:MAG: hypothetical protein ABIG03_00820 [Candidatus Eisenbacteria bacterium]
MANRYWLAVLAIVLIASSAAFGQLQQEVNAVKNCIGLFQAGGAHISLTPGTAYDVSVDGNAKANPDPDSFFDGLFIFYYDNGDVDHPVTKYLEKGAVHSFVASSIDFYAFLVDKGLKDVPDNSGFLTLTFTGGDKSRETLVVDAVFNCLGLEDFGSIKNVDVPPDYLCALSIAWGDAATNGMPSGGYEGVFVFTRDRNRPLHPIILELEYGQEFTFEMHATSWIYMFLVDQSYADIGNNYGSIMVEMEATEITTVEEETWTAIKALYQ